LQARKKNKVFCYYQANHAPQLRILLTSLALNVLSENTIR